MPGDVGAVAKLVETVAGWFLSEEGYGEFKTRRELSKAKQAAVRRLQAARSKEDWAAVRDAIYALERLSARP